MANYTTSTGVRLNALQKAFLNALASQTSIPIHVTSGERSFREQAQILKGLIDRGNNLAVYSKDYREGVLARYPNVAAIEAFISQRYVPPGRHLTGEAVDLRVVNLTQAQKASLRGTIENMGAGVLHEYNPEHFHVSNIQNARIQLPALAGGFPWWGWALLGVGGAATLYLAYRYRDLV